MDETNQNQDSYRQRNYHFYGRVFPGVWLILIGVIFILSNFGFLHGDVWGKLWPVFIIIPGIFMLLRPRR